MFIKLVGADSLPVLQPLLFAASLAFLGFETFASTRSLVISVGLMSAIAVNSELNKYHSMVMTEFLFMSVLVVLLGSLIRFARAKDLTSLAVAAILAGLAATIRPPGYALLPIPLLMVFVCRRQLAPSGRALTTTALVAITLIIGGERIFSTLMHREGALSLFPHHVFAKAAMIDTPARSASEQDPLRRLFLNALDNDYAPIRRLIGEAPDRDTRILLTANYETCLEYACTDPLRAAARSPVAVVNSLQLRVGFERLASAPLNYIGRLWTHYQALWVLYSQTHPEPASAVARFIASHRPLPFEELVRGLVTNPPVNRLASVARPMILFVGWITSAIVLLGAVGAWRGQLRGSAAVAYLAALAIHGTFVFTAAFGVGIP